MSLGLVGALTVDILVAIVAVLAVLFLCDALIRSCVRGGK
jgi:hypothetical protein